MAALKKIVGFILLLITVGGVSVLSVLHLIPRALS